MNLPELTKMPEQPPNPYQRDGKWYWYDESEEEYGPYVTEDEATYIFLQYMEILELGE